MKIGDTVRLKPLEWEFMSPDWWRADCVFSVLNIRRRDHTDRWYFEWCVEDFNGDEGKEPVQSPYDGIRRAEEWYLDRLSGVFECLPSCTT